MKHVTISLLRNILGVSVLAASVALSSCETIYDDLAPCRTEYRMKFLYNRNMKFADAFAGEVESVGLWLFDTAGNMVWSGSESGEALRAEDYAMTLDVAPGTYDAIAWCGLAGGDAYYLASDKVSRKEDLILGIRRRQTDGAATVDNDLHRLYHGFERIVLAEPEGGGTVTAEMSLTKNTNVVRIMLQHLDGSPVRSEDFDFTIEESNAVMNYDNAILGNDPVLYRSWIKTETSAWFDEEDNRMYDDPDPTGGGRARRRDARRGQRPDGRAHRRTTHGRPQPAARRHATDRRQTHHTHTPDPLYAHGQGRIQQVDERSGLSRPSGRLHHDILHRQREPVVHARRHIYQLVVCSTASGDRNITPRNAVS